MKKILALFSVLFISTVLNAQNTSEDYLGAWYTLGVNHTFTEHFSLMPYAELRFYEPTSNYNLTFLSLNANYHIKNSQTITLAAAYLDIDSYLGSDNIPNTIEHRIMEQYSKKHKLGNLSIQHRLRFEQRFLKYTDRNELQHRFRYRLSLKYPLSKTLFLGLTEEPFVNFQDQVFHENRFYAGIGFNILKHAQLQMGYLKRHAKKKNLNRIQVGISIQTDSRKPKTTLKP
ncbi:DUF2490 domain-containing protein [Winogradskyella undariae]|uniref:DUF2490 domain-containing protein n=1 Tax=Winogradskyella undariae TaxID=1285465 RepID=UPI00156A84B5|nr:DUF2490 domain-containing protein [Winogradskyella undariae]NRR90481.1 DUF2490 domain-containing protein [Winogradskyella undariae]